jgi:ribonuclease R
MLERRAMEAERETIDRYVAAYLADQVGQLVECRITGVQPFGFFATVEDLGGDGLVLAQTLGHRIFPLRRGRTATRRRERPARPIAWASD